MHIISSYYHKPGTRKSANWLRMMTYKLIALGSQHVNTHYTFRPQFPSESVLTLFFRSQDACKQFGLWTRLIPRFHLCREVCKPKWINHTTYIELIHHLGTYWWVDVCCC